MGYSAGDLVAATLRADGHQKKISKRNHRQKDWMVLAMLDQDTRTGAASYVTLEWTRRFVSSQMVSWLWV